MSEDRPVVFRLARSAYLVVLFLVFGAIPLAFTDTTLHLGGNVGGEDGPPLTVGWQTLFLLIPLLVAVFIRRTATLVDADGVRIRALLGTRRFGWDDVRGLSIQGRSVYLMTAGGGVRMPCVHVADLARLSAASGGRLPEISRPAPKFAPARRRRG